MPTVDSFISPDTGSHQEELHPFLFTESDGLGMYMDQVNNFYDNGTMDVDDALAAWYSSMIDEMQPHRSFTAPTHD